MVAAKGKKKVEETKPVVIVVNGDEFDSSKGTMTMGEMRQLEDLGVDFAALQKIDEMPVTKIAKIATVCLRSASGGGAEGTVDTNMDYVDRIPADKFAEVTAFVIDFYSRNFQGSAEVKKDS